jgi:glutathione peroxidase
VKAGESQSPIFEFLGTKTGELPGWNFGKYVVSRDGKRAVFFASMTKPDDAKVIAAIEKMLAEPAPVAKDKAPAAPTKPADSAAPAAPAIPAQPK